MTFEEILDHAIAMLQRRGRLTYSTLKRQFQLDDAALDDLKNELIEGQRLAVDERGIVLVWMGGTASIADPAASPTQTTVCSLRRPTRPGLAPASAVALRRCRTTATHGDVLRPGGFDCAGQPA